MLIVLSSSVDKYFKITFVLEHIMSIIGDATKDGICVSGVPFVDFLGLHIKPVWS